MIDRNGVLFYTSDDVNYDRVHAAMSEVGRRIEAERLARLAIRHAEIVRRGGRVCEGTDLRVGRRCEHGACLRARGLWLCEYAVTGWWHEPNVDAAAQPPAHDYGPHREEDAQQTVVVGRLRKWRGERDVEIAVSPEIREQTRQLSGRAHAAAQAAFHPTPKERTA